MSWRIAVAYDYEACDKFIGLYNADTGDFAPFGVVGSVQALDTTIEAFEAVAYGEINPAGFATRRPAPRDVDLLYYDPDPRPELVDV
jgi:hypothetical protein